jgi:hypothetical protein
LQRGPFEGLLVAIRGTDGLVYVEEGRCGFSVHACLWLSVTVAGRSMIVRPTARPSGRWVRSLTM